MKFAVLSSGSKANCTVIQSPNGKSILIDCGLSARETLKRLTAVGIEPQTLQGIFITHEHRDHTVGIRVLSAKLNIPIYANAGTATALELKQIITADTLVKITKTGHPVIIDDLSIQPFAISHDAAEPVGYVVTADNLKFVYATDLGKVTTLVKSCCQDCQAMVLEFNHDEKLLWECDYPWELKQRIISNRGHLSNKSASILVKETIPSGLKHLVLAHISEHSNTPETAMRTLEEDVNISDLETCVCANPYQPTPPIQLISNIIINTVENAANY